MMRIIKRIFSTILSLVLPQNDASEPAKVFARKKSRSIGTYLYIIICILCVVFLIAPSFIKNDISYTDVSQQNLPPTFSLTRLDSAVRKHADAISAGYSYTISVSDGVLYIGGEPPCEIKAAEGSDFVMVSAGYDHALALRADGTVEAMGSDRFGQCTLPSELYTHGKIVYVAAGYQVSYAVSDDGCVIAFGAGQGGIIFDTQRAIVKLVPLRSGGAMALWDDGSLAFVGNVSKEFTDAMEALSGVIDIAATNDTAAAVLADGSAVVFGKARHGEDLIPGDVKLAHISGGEYHYAAISDDNMLFAWGDSSHRKTDIPSYIKNVASISCGGYQSYAITDDGNAYGFGLSSYPMGTDSLGRDIFTRLLCGGRTALSISIAAMLISTFLGMLLGAISGYCGGRTDMVLMRMAEITGAIPLLPFVMLICSVIAGASTQNQRTLILIMLLGVLGWPTLARLVRAQTLLIKKSDFILAARACGIKPLTIILRHVLPNLTGLVATNATLAFSRFLLVETSLSYLGLGVTPPYPSWGNMLSAANSSTVIQNYPWQWIFPAIAIALCVICANAIAERFTDRADD